MASVKLYKVPSHRLIKSIKLELPFVWSSTFARVRLHIGSTICWSPVVFSPNIVLHEIVKLLYFVSNVGPTLKVLSYMAVSSMFDFFKLAAIVTTSRSSCEFETVESKMILRCDFLQLQHKLFRLIVHDAIHLIIRDYLTSAIEDIPLRPQRRPTSLQ